MKLPLMHYDKEADCYCWGRVPFVCAGWIARLWDRLPQYACLILHNEPGIGRVKVKIGGTSWAPILYFRNATINGFYSRFEDFVRERHGETFYVELRDEHPEECGERVGQGSLG